MTDEYRLRVFGHPELMDGSGRAIPFTTRHQAGVLTYLVVEAAGQPVRRSTIAELFWPDTDEERARHSLSQAISGIRKKIGKEAVVSRDGTVRLTIPIATELDRNGDNPFSLEDLPEALLGMEDIGGVSLSHWIDLTRSTLNERLRGLMQAELEALRAGGNTRALRRKAEVLYRLDPMNDEAVIVLAEDTLMDNDDVGAIALLRAHATRIKEMCGGKPIRKVVELLQRLELGEKRILKVLQPVVTMVGRDPEMADLESVWNTIREGGSVSALIAGHPGIGKTTLIDKFSATVRARQSPVYSIRCHEMGRRIPFSSISDLIHQLAETPEVGGTNPVMLAEASRVAPGLRTVYPGIPEAPRAEPDSIRVRVAGALFDMTHEITDGNPILISFDDIHNMDQASRDVLYVLYHRMRRQAAMFLCSARSAEAGKVVSRHDIMPWGSITKLHPLDRDSSRSLLKAVAGDLDDELFERVLQLGEDNPHLIEILVSDYRENGVDSLICVSEEAAAGFHNRVSETMKRALAGLLFGLTADSQRILDLISIVERPITVTEVMAISGVEESVASAAGLELLERGLVRFDGEALTMKNELHRLYVRSRMNPDIRRFIHARLARHVSPKADEHQANTFEEAHHLMGADAVTEAVKRVVSGAQTALDHGAPKEAERAIMATGNAVQVNENHNLRFLLAKSLVLQGEFSSAAQMLRSIIREQKTDQTGDIERLLAESLLRGPAEHQGEVVALVEKSLECARRAGDDLRMATTLQLLVESAVEIGDNQLALSAVASAAEITTTSRSREARGKASLTMGFYSMMNGDPKAAAQGFEKTRQLLEPLLWDRSFRRAMNGLGIAYTGTGQHSKAEEAFRATIGIAEEIGETHGAMTTYANLGCLLADQGRYVEAHHCFEKALDSRERRATPVTFTERYINSAQFATIVGRPDKAVELLEMAEEAARQSGTWQDRAHVLAAKADYQLSIGEYVQAWGNVDEARVMRERNSGAIGIDQGQWGRLLRHYIYANEGLEPFLTFIKTAPAADYSRIGNRLETMVFEAWVKTDAGLEIGPREAVAAIGETVRRGLYGILARLHSLNVLPANLPPSSLNATSAEIVAAAFDSPHRMADSGSLPWKQQGA